MNSTDAKNPTDLAAENTQLRQELAGLKNVSILEQPIQEKMAAGLTREQAIAAIEHQQKFTKRFDEVSADRKAAHSKP